MGQAILAKFGSGQSGGGYTQKTVIINTTQTWKVPKAKGQNFAVRIFGGGGGEGNRSGGGGGNMSNTTLKLNEGDFVQVTIGNGGSYGVNGGTTSFGTYLSATGGECGSPKGAYDPNGGNGGTGGGTAGQGGIGGSGTYGGGGGGWIGGNGGTYGGGGAGYNKGGISLGGWGNGGSSTIRPTDGLNTVNLADKLDFAGVGRHGKLINSTASGDYNNDYGGGGYGGNGGDSYNQYTLKRTGGGGFGGNGGSVLGGGGGYGGDGLNGVSEISPGTYGGGGGGGYGPENYGAGGGRKFSGSSSGEGYNGKSGVCIISYLEPVQ